MARSSGPLAAFSLWVLLVNNSSKTLKFQSFEKDRIKF